MAPADLAPILDSVADESAEEGEQVPHEEGPRMWNGFNLTALKIPMDAMPTGDSKGKFSYTVPHGQNGRIDVILKKASFYVKTPAKAKGTISWKKFENGIEGAWAFAKQKVQEAER